MTDTIDIVVPDSEESSEATVLDWLKKPGDAVAAHEPLLELSTDKVTVEIPSPADGVLSEILCEPNTVVHPGTVLGKLSSTPPTGQQAPRDDADDEIDWSDPHSDDYPGFRLSPLVKRMLREHGLDPSSIRGSGRDGRITHRDVLAHIEGEDAIEPGAISDDAQASEAQSQPHPESEETAAGPFESAEQESIRVPHSAMRRSIATHMVDSMLRTAPHVTSVFEVDLSAVLSHKQLHSDEADRRGIRLTLTSYFIRAMATAAVAVPQINSRWHDDALEVFRAVNVGMATALGDDGLIVPVVRRAQSLNLWETAARVSDLTARARMGALTREDVSGGTLTITNHGVSGSLMATPIINQPESAIVGIGRVEKRVKAIQVDGRDTIQILPMAYVSLTIDHRALDGHQANRFLSAFVETLESWA